MAIWLNTKGKGTLGIGLCDRCHFKFSLEDLMPDGNAPGLRVCKRCCDVLDPYRLPARQPDDITLPFYRPILPSLVFDTAVIEQNGLSTDGGQWLEADSLSFPPGNGMYGIEVTE
jgi:hypothetical protein